LKFTTESIDHNDDDEAHTECCLPSIPNLRSVATDLI